MITDGIDAKAILFQDTRIGAMMIKNRIVMAPLYLGKRYFTREFCDFFYRRAEGGVGALIIPLPTFDGYGELAKQDFFDKAAVFLAKCHGWNCKVIAQIFTGDGEQVNVMSTKEIEAIPDAYAEASLCVRTAGFDGIEIHGAHHSLFMHLLSPLLNKREDRFGVSYKNNSWIQEETVRKTRQALGNDFPVIYRFSATEFTPGGFSLDQTVPFAKTLEEAGVDAVHVSAGGTGASPKYSDCPDHRESYGCFSVFSREIKKQVKVPVIVAGRIATRECAETILENGSADLVGLCRVLIADPQWPNKIREGRDSDIVPMDRWWDLYREEFARVNPGEQA